MDMILWASCSSFAMLLSEALQTWSSWYYTSSPLRGTHYHMLDYVNSTMDMILWVSCSSLAMLLSEALQTWSSRYYTSSPLRGTHYHYARLCELHNGYDIMSFMLFISNASVWSIANMELTILYLFTIAWGTLSYTLDYVNSAMGMILWALCSSFATLLIFQCFPILFQKVCRQDYLTKNNFNG